jgi:hypothetical protein
MNYAIKCILGINISIQKNGKDILMSVIPESCNDWSGAYEAIWIANNNSLMQSVCDRLNGSDEEIDIIAELNFEIARLAEELRKQEEINELLRTK